MFWNSADTEADFGQAGFGSSGMCTVYSFIILSIQSSRGIFRHGFQSTGSLSRIMIHKVITEMERNRLVCNRKLWNNREDCTA